MCSTRTSHNAGHPHSIYLPRLSPQRPCGGRTLLLKRRFAYFPTLFGKTFATNIQPDHARVEDVTINPRNYPLLYGETYILIPLVGAKLNKNAYVPRHLDYNLMCAHCERPVSAGGRWASKQDLHPGRTNPPLVCSCGCFSREYAGTAKKADAFFVRAEFTMT